jgi:hypothetical protein
VSPVKYELGVYIPEDGILHSHRREYLRIVQIFSLNTVYRGSGRGRGRGSGSDCYSEGCTKWLLLVPAASPVL